jgi:Viral BACON domain/Fibronectin type III domain
MRHPTTLIKHTGWLIAGILGLLLHAGEVLAFPYAPTTLIFTATDGTSSPPAQTVVFSKKAFVPQDWTATATSSWLMISPASGTVTTEKDTISVQVNPSGLSAGTYSSSFTISVTAKNDRIQTATIPVTFVISTGGTSTTPSTTTTTTPSILLNPTSLSFSGTAGGGNPLAKTINLVNSTGGTLTWSMTESAAWLALNITSGTTTSETDQVSASVGVQGLAAGTYSTVITVAASGASNSPKQIPVSLTLSQPTTGSANLTWTANTELDLAGYKVHMGTQPGIYNPPITLGTATTYNATNLTSGKTYYFCVSAFDNAGNDSPCSAEISKPIL